MLIGSRRTNGGNGRNDFAKLEFVQNGGLQDYDAKCEEYKQRCKASRRARWKNEKSFQVFQTKTSGQHLRYRRFVRTFPAASRPTINILISFLPNIRSQIREKWSPYQMIQKRQGKEKKRKMQILYKLVLSKLRRKVNQQLWKMNAYDWDKIKQQLTHHFCN